MSKSRYVATCAATKKIGFVGMFIGSEEIVLTSTGRETSPFPKFRCPVKFTKQLERRVNLWLIENALAEALARQDDYVYTIFKSEDPGNLPQASRDCMEEYLFGVAK